jgi:hypothetical protein
LAAVRAREPTRVRVVADAGPATLISTRIAVAVDVPTMSCELGMSRTAQEGAFSPELSVRPITRAGLLEARFTLTTTPGDVRVPKKAEPEAGSDTPKATLFSPEARVMEPKMGPRAPGALFSETAKMVAGDDVVA